MSLKIIGNLPNSINDMVVIDISSGTVKNIMDECQPMDPKIISWSSVNRDTWFACINTSTNKGYYFPICESENRENNFDRVKKGMDYFFNQGFEVFKLQ